MSWGVFLLAGPANKPPHTPPDSLRSPFRFTDHGHKKNSEYSRECDRWVRQFIPHRPRRVRRFAAKNTRVRQHNTMTKLQKSLLIASIGLNVILLLITLVVWPVKEPPTDLSKYTQQDLEQALLIQSGMLKEDVRKIMGSPALREIENTMEEWHYCKTGSSVDEYVAISFENDKVVRLRNYSVSWLDIAFHYMKAPTKEMIEAGGFGDCKLTARWSSFNQDTPSYRVNE